MFEYVFLHVFKCILRSLLKLNVRRCVMKRMYCLFFSFLVAINVPSKIEMGMSKDDQTFRNLSLSFRGAERQPPNLLQMALRFSKVMDRNAAGASGNTEARLKRVIQEFNSSPGLHVKHQVEGEKERAVLNLIVGSCKDEFDKRDMFCLELL